MRGKRIVTLVTAISLVGCTTMRTMEAEKETIQRVLFQTNWNRKKASRILNISYKTLLQKIKESGLAEDR